MLTSSLDRASGEGSRVPERLSARAALFVLVTTSLSLWLGCAALVNLLRHL
jgi:hypothetical protein